MSIGIKEIGISFRASSDIRKKLRSLRAMTDETMFAELNQIRLLRAKVDPSQDDAVICYDMLDNWKNVCIIMYEKSGVVPPPE